MSWDYNDSREYLRRQGGRMDPLVISVAITGGVHGKETNPHLPETPDEQADEARRCYEAGASVVHIHAREPATGFADATARPEQYRDAFKKIRDRCPDMIVSITGAGGPRLDRAGRQAPLDALPEMADIDMGPFVWNVTLKRRMPPLAGREDDERLQHVVPLTPEEHEDRARRIRDRGIKAECAVFHSGQWGNVHHLIDQGLLPAPYVCQILMGVAGGELPTPHNVINSVRLAPKGCVLSVAAIGRYETSIAAIGVILGLNVVVGLENNIFYSRGMLSQGNAPLVERVARLARELDRAIATPTQAREMLGLAAEPRMWA
jgi:3-keto-5-aminohexanoate cleavage enzyme